MNRVTSAFNHLGEVIDSGEIEQKRDLIVLYLQRVDADPSTNTLNIKLYPPLFDSIIGGTAGSSGGR